MRRKMLSCREISFEEILDWDKLVETSPTASFFQNKEWLSSWNKHFGNGSLILGVFENQNLIGIAPFLKKDGKINFLGTSPVLGKELVTDYGDIIALADKESLIWQGILKKLKNDYQDFKLDLCFLREDSPSFKILRDLGGKIKEIDVAPYLNLPSNWEQYLNLLDRHNRHELRRKIRRLERQKAFQICPEGEPSDLDEFFRLMALPNDQKRDFLSPKMREFFQDIFATFWPQKKLSLCFLKIKGENVASVLLFFFKDEVLLYNSGFDPKFSLFSPGLLLKAYVVKNSIEKGKKVFDFLRGGERYKYDLGGKDKKLYRILIK